MNRKGFSPLIVIGIIAVIVAVGVVGYFVWKNSANPPSSTPVNSTTTMASSTPTSTPDLGAQTQASTTTLAIATTSIATASSTQLVSTSGWLTYTDNGIGITIKYPSNWYIQNISTLPGFFYLGDTNPENIQEKSPLEFRVELRAINNTLPIEEWYQQYFASYPLPNVTAMNQVEVDGLPAIQVIIKSGAYYYYFVADGGHVFDIEFANDTHINTYETILNDVVLFPVNPPQGNFSVSGANIFPQLIVTSTVSEVGYEGAYNNMTMAAGNSMNGEALLVSQPTTPPYFPYAQEYVLSQAASDTIGFAEEAITNPENTSTVFLATATFATNTTDLASTDTVYSYNLLNGNVVQIYQVPAPNGNILRPIGIQGSKLIFWDTLSDNSPGPCWNVWAADGNRGLLYLDLGDIAVGLRSFVAPQEVVASATAQENQCVIEMLNE